MANVFGYSSFVHVPCPGPYYIEIYWGYEFVV
jgi:hypothetical protein